MTNSSDLISVIIVNYKSSALIKECLKSVNTFSTRKPEVIIVDNANETAALQSDLGAVCPGIKVLDAGYNAGFARANNIGIKESKGDTILLLNPDTIVLNDAINGCAEQLRQSEFAAAGVQLIHSDGTAQFSGSRNMPGGLNVLLPVPFFGNIFRALALAFGAKKPGVENPGIRTEVDWINGAFLMVKRSAIGKAGMLDEDFFLYAEETEWCSRLRKVGKLCLFGEFKVIHLEGETANATFGSVNRGYQNMFDRKGGQIMLSNLVRIRKEFGVETFLLQLFIYTLAIPFSLFVKPGSAGIYARNVFRVLRLSGKIIMRKPYFYKVL